MLSGRRVGTAGEEFVFDDSEYADDTALCYASRRDAEQQTGPLMAHFGDWGMEVHAGKPGKDSKSERVQAQRFNLFMRARRFE